MENRVTEATDLAQKFQTQEQTQLGNLQDTDIPTTATELSQLQSPAAGVDVGGGQLGADEEPVQLFGLTEGSR